MIFKKNIKSISVKVEIVKENLKTNRAFFKAIQLMLDLPKFDEKLDTILNFYLDKNKQNVSY